jgi:hypothetical protein
MDTFVSEILPLALVLAAAYLATVWRQGWRWVLGMAALGAVVAWLLMQWADARNGQVMLGGLLQVIAALMVGVGVVTGAVVQGIDALRPNGGSVAFRAWGLAVVIGAMSAFVVTIS